MVALPRTSRSAICAVERPSASSARISDSRGVRRCCGPLHACPHVLDESRLHLLADDRLAPPDAADGVADLGAAGLLGDIARGSGLQRARDAVAADERGDEQHARRQVLGGDPREQFHPVEVWKHVVDESDVGSGTDCRERLLGSCARRGHLDVVAGS